MEEASALVSGWAWLPSNLLDLILEKLIPISDYIRFSAVCKQWQSVALHQKQQRLKSCHKLQLPMLMIPGKYNTYEKRGLYNATKGKTYSFELHVPYNNRCCGSSHGWLACVDEKMVVTLLNPFTKRTICLPPFTQVPRFIREQTYTCDHYIHKVVLSADPSLFPNDYEAVVVYDCNGTKLAHFKSGDYAWTHIDQKVEFYYGLYQIIGFDDVIYYRGQFLATSRLGGIYSIHVGNDPTNKPHASIVVPMVPTTADKSYLVESSGGDLLLVRKFESINFIECFIESLSFKVFKLFCGVGEIESIGNDALFLGDNQSLCVSSLDFPRCHPNSIYFCIDEWGVDVAYDQAQGPLDMTVFNLEKRSLGMHYYYLGRSKKYMPPSIWILPTMV